MHVVIIFVAASQAGISRLQSPSARPVLAGWLLNHCSAEGPAWTQQSVGLVAPSSRLAVLTLPGSAADTLRSPGQASSPPLLSEALGDNDTPHTLTRK